MRTGAGETTRIPGRVETAEDEEVNVNNGFGVAWRGTWHHVRYVNGRMDPHRTVCGSRVPVQQAIFNAIRSDRENVCKRCEAITAGAS